MLLTSASTDNPIAVIVAILLVSVFGLLSLQQLPIQLTPEVEEPGITITTIWRGASPNEIESEIIEPQEDSLRGLPGMRELSATAQEGRAELSLNFSVDMDMRRALIEVISRLNQVSDYPVDAENPVISSLGADASAIAWFIIKPLPGNDRPISSYQEFLEEVVQSRFEQVRGVARSNVYGGTPTELRITFDPYRLADLDLRLPVINRFIGASENVSAGFQDIGKREYNLRYIGEYDAEQLGSMILDWRDSKPVYLRDVAEVEVRTRDREGFVITKGSSAIAINAERETGVNVLEVMNGLRQAKDELEQGVLKRAGLGIEQVYDETVYIDRSIEMLSSNLILGVILAIITLFFFLHSIRPTLLIALTIPCCLLGSFLFMYLFGRTLNVISLAGLALSVGMVLDASLISLENIIRLRAGSMSAQEAANRGVRQVWGALLASTVTTIALFLPVLYLRDEAGQLFADLAMAIVAAISLSLLVAVTVIPALSKKVLSGVNLRDPYAPVWEFGTRIVMILTDGMWRRIFWIAFLITVPLILAWQFKPQADYLPTGNRNLVFAYILPPPGASTDNLEQEMGEHIISQLQPYLDGDREPQIKHYFFVSFAARGVFLGARAVADEQAAELVPVVNAAVQGIPDTLAFARQTSLFQGIDGGRTIDMNIQGRDLEKVLQASLYAYLSISEKFPGSKIRPRPGLELAQPELRLIPDERRIAEAGWTRSVMAQILRTLGDGLYVGDYFDGEKSIDIIVRAIPWKTVEELKAIPIVTPESGVLPLTELVNVESTVGPNEIRRIDRRRTVTLEINPPEDMSLENALQRLKSEISPAVLTRLGEDGEVRYAGVADKLSTTLQSMTQTFVLALIILYLLLSALFRSFLQSLLIMLSLPLATVGGVLALHALNYVTAQNMDLLTMIGFVILLGIVVNNAILLVHYTRQEERNGSLRRQAVNNAVRQRFRPIILSTLTSISGMLPLLVMSGAGTELYRGLAAVIIGGMAVSTLFTLILLPSLLRIGEGHPNRKV